MSEISKEQRSAIELVQEITSEVVDNPHIREAFCKEVRTNILGQEGVNIQPYRNVLSAVLNGKISDKNLSNYTLRNATWNILKVLTEEGEFSNEERNRITYKVVQGGGKRGVIATQKVQGMSPLTEEERSILNEIFKSNNSEYKRGTTRNIKKIMEKLEGESGIHRDSVYTVKRYLQNLSTAPKKEFIPRNNPEEIQTLRDLFTEYYDPSKKLPTKIIMQRLNEKYGNNRTENSIEGYIRTYIKTKEQKQKIEEKWSNEETFPLKFFQDKKEIFRIKRGKGAGKVNWHLIYQLYKKMIPNTNRTQRALEHKLKALREKNENKSD